MIVNTNPDPQNHIISFQAVRSIKNHCISKDLIGFYGRSIRPRNMLQPVICIKLKVVPETWVSILFLLAHFQKICSIMITIYIPKRLKQISNIYLSEW